jgi:hypothetical protein
VPLPCPYEGHGGVISEHERAAQRGCDLRFRGKGQVAPPRIMIFQTSGSNGLVGREMAGYSVIHT